MTDNRGRPFDTAVDEAILTTTKALLEAKGFDRLTVSEIVERAGTTRSAFYRRYMSLLDLITDLFLHEFPTELDVEFDTGSLTSDLRAIQVDQQDFFTTPMVYQGLPGFLGKLRADDDARQAAARRGLRQRQGPGSLRRLSGAAAVAERLRFRRFAAAHIVDLAAPPSGA